MIEILLAVLLGILAGIITGLIPGIHVNLVSAILLSLSGFFLGFVDVVTLSVFIISMAVIHTFLDTIPSIYLGAPDTESAMGVLPGHRMLLQGRGYEAIKLTVIGSYGSLLFVIVLAPVLVFLMSTVQPILQPWIGWILLSIVVWMTLKEKKRMLAAFLFLLSGALGLTVLNLGVKQPLFPMLSGLFGLSTMLISLNEKVNIPPQKIRAGLPLQKRQMFASVGVAGFVGSLVGFFPGVGPAQAAVIGSQFLRGGNKNFLILVGGLSTANMVASMVTFYTLDKARNGAIVAVRVLLEEIALGQFVLFLIVALIAGSAGVVLTLFFARRFAFWLQKVKYAWLCLFVIVLILVLVPVISGWLGVAVLVVSTATGMIAPLTNVSRSQAMGCLLLPVILWFLL
jgi:putative membrane protein